MSFNTYITLYLLNCSTVFYFYDIMIFVNISEEIPVPALEQIFIKEEFIEEEFIKEKLVKKELIKEEFVKGESITEDLVKEKLINEKFVKGKFIKEESLKKEFMKKEFTHANNETLHDSPITPGTSLKLIRLSLTKH